jgi:hypothetical protein
VYCYVLIGLLFKEPKVAMPQLYVLLALLFLLCDGEAVDEKERKNKSK